MHFNVSETLSGISQTSFDSDSDQSTVKSVNMNDDDYDDKSPKQRKWKSQKDVFETELTKVKHESAPKKLPQKSSEVSSPFHGSPRAPERRRHSNASHLGPVTPPRGIYSSQRRISAESRNSIKQDDQEKRKHFPSYETHAEATKNDKVMNDCIILNNDTGCPNKHGNSVTNSISYCIRLYLLKQENCSIQTE